MNRIPLTPESEAALTALAELCNKIERLESQLSAIRPALNGECYITDLDLSERLCVSRRTTQEWRDSGVIEYIQFKGKIIYAESAIERFLAKHHHKTWAS